MASSTKLCSRPATEIAGLVQDREASASEVLEMHLEQLERVNPRVNAICPRFRASHRRG
jgi:amidase